MTQVYKTNKKFYIRAVTLALLVIMACTFTMIMIGNPDTTTKNVVFLLMCLVAGPTLFGLIYLLIELFSKKPRLILGPGGLLDACRGSHSGSISWHNIHHISGFQRGRFKYLSIGINDVRPLIEQQDITHRVAYGKQLERNKEHVAIMLNQLKGDPDEIFEAVKQKWKEATGRE